MCPVARRTIHIVVMAVVAFALSVVPASADLAIGAGMAMYGNPVGVLLMPGVVIIEAIVAKRVLRVPLGLGFLVAVVANFASALVGAMVVSFLFGNVGGRNVTAGVRFLIVASPILFVVSALIEIPVVKRLVPYDCRPRVLRWAIEANLISYAMMAAAAALSLWALTSPAVVSLVLKWGL